MNAAATHIDSVAEAYVADVLETLEANVHVLDSFVLGSGLVGGYRPGESDLDLVVVVDAPFGGEARQAVIERIAALELPVRRLELVVYVRGRQPPDFELNLEVGSEAAREAPDEPGFWFVIDAALAQERISRWSEYFDPIPEERLREALVQSIAWSQARPVDDEFARVNAIRSRHYLETGEWMSKQDAAR